jgi:predicted nucleotidyltransferase
LDAIRECSRRRFGEGCTIRLFGSRTDDSRRGGDIDLHIEAESDEMARLANELAFRRELKDRIGEQRIDVTVRAPHHTSRAIDLIAVQNGVPIP